MLFTKYLECIHFERVRSLESALIHFTVTPSLLKTELENKRFKLHTNHCHAGGNCRAQTKSMFVDTVTFGGDSLLALMVYLLNNL